MSKLKNKIYLYYIPKPVFAFIIKIIKAIK